ncbi:hypothetical protein RF11_05285 [Thelohanellus kitauei]|uniref:Uncharacterized protein n=1 Tax=Thelohanellus kitauei TaxID=669202 RepID=A0A0C2MXY8_THEKT|nr:hypothetical protein RF11_05285 [Thelohanellus kitauei]
MKSRNNIDNVTNQKAMNFYVLKSQAPGIETQISAVTNYIQNFSINDDPGIDHLFLEHFPNKLMSKLKSISECQTNDYTYPKIANLLFRTFMFIYRNHTFLDNPQACNFINIFLKFLKNKEKVQGFLVEELMDKINICVSCDKNKVFFINENGVPNIYNYFSIPKTTSSDKFWEICEKVYKLDSRFNSGLCPAKLTENVNKLMTESFIESKIDSERLLCVTFGMINHARLLDEVQFDVIKFYDITTSILSHINENNNSYPKHLHYLSKTWCGIFNGSKNTFLIDTIDKLTIFAALFSISVSEKLDKLGDIRNLEVNKKLKQKLLIIYLTMIVFPTIDHATKPWLHKILIYVHNSLKTFIDKKTISNLTIESQCFIFQNYFKSTVLFDDVFLPYQQSIFIGFLERLSSYPSSNRLLLSDSNNDDNRNTIKEFLYCLITSLHDGMYIKKLHEEEKLILYEDTKNTCISMISDDVVQQVFSLCESHLCKDKLELSTDSEHHTLKIYNQLMKMIINSFNESNYLDDIKATDCYLLFQIDSNKSLHMPRVPNIPDRKYNSKISSEKSSNAETHEKSYFFVLLNWFQLTFELKFIFGGINSNLKNLDMNTSI